jgi:hypothetical protein
VPAAEKAATLPASPALPAVAPLPGPPDRVKPAEAPPEAPKPAPQVSASNRDDDDDSAAVEGYLPPRPS